MMRTVFAAAVGLMVCAICSQAAVFQDKCPDTGTEIAPEKTHGSGPKDRECQQIYPARRWSCHRYMTVVPEHNKCAAGGTNPGFRCKRDGVKPIIKYRGKCGSQPEECTYDTDSNPEDPNVGMTPNFKNEPCD